MKKWVKRAAIGGLVLALIACLGIGAMLYLQKKAEAEAEAADEEDVEQTEAPAKKQKAEKESHAAAPLYHLFPEPFTSNLVPDKPGDGAYIQTNIALTCKDQEADKVLTLLEIPVKAAITQELSTHKMSELRGEGMRTLQADLKATINAVLQKQGGVKDKEPVTEVLFTTFIMQ